MSGDQNPVIGESVGGDSTMPWWQSRVIWTQVITFVVTILTGFGVNVSGFTSEVQTAVISLLVTVGSVLTIVFRVKSTKVIK